MLEVRTNGVFRPPARMAGAATLALAVILVLGTPLAAAAERFVTPDGVGSDCTQATPCDIVTGINSAVSGDTVHVAGDGGPYAPTMPLSVPQGVSVIGEGSQTPRIEFGETVAMGVPPGAAISRLDLSKTGPFVLLGLGGTGSALRVESSEGVPVELQPGLLRDSFVRTTGAMVPAIQTSFAAATVHNVTAVADGAESAAVRIVAPPPEFPDFKCAPTSIQLRNVVARGAQYDLQAIASLGCSATIDVGFSNYRAGATSIDGVLLDAGGNQTGLEPLFATDRLHQLLGSPTIDAGVLTAQSGATDVDGEPRVLGAAPDIGADELAPAPAPTDAVAPVGSKLRLTPRRFRPRRARSASVAAASARRRGKRSPRSSTVRYQLSEPARVRFIVLRSVTGRRKGKRCVVGRRASGLRGGKRCRKFVSVGTFAHAGGRGANRFRFTGFVRRRPLKPGAHRLVGIPVDIAGNRGRRFGAPFVIAPR